MILYRIFYMAYMSWLSVTVHSPTEIETGCHFDSARPASAFCVYNLRENGDYLSKP